MSEANGISITPKGMGAIVAEMMEGTSDDAFFAKYQEVCANLVATWRSQGFEFSDIRRFLHQYAAGASFRRAELERGQAATYPEGRA